MNKKISFRSIVIRELMALGLTRDEAIREYNENLKNK